MHTELSLSEIKKEWHGTLTSYLVGFFLSLVLTAASFSLVMTGVLDGSRLVYALVILAMIQAVVQLIFFLHIGKEAKPKWETLIFAFMVFVLLIIVIGSLWVMNDLNDRVMSTMNEMHHD